MGQGMRAFEKKTSIRIKEIKFLWFGGKNKNASKINLLTFFSIKCRMVEGEKVKIIRI